MDTSEFWALVEQARTDASGGGRPPAGAAVGSALAARLAPLPPERIVEFHRCFERMAARAHRWDMCAAAYVIWGYISDDGFGDFKAGLVGLGRGAFEQVVNEPDALAEHPMVLAIAAGRIAPFALAAESLHFASAEAYEQAIGDPDAFWEALEAHDAESDPAPSDGDGWPGRFGGPEDAALIPQRLPRLHALFSDHVHPSK